MSKGNGADNSLDVNFDDDDVQQASWNAMRDVMLAAMAEAVEQARALHPVCSQVGLATREGLIMNQLHMITASLLGDIEGKILRHTMTTSEQLEARREEYLKAGRIGSTVKT